MTMMMLRVVRTYPLLPSLFVFCKWCVFVINNMIAFVFLLFSLACGSLLTIPILLDNYPFSIYFIFCFQVFHRIC